MSLSLRIFSVAPILVVALGAYSCSSSQPAGDSGNPGSEAGATSGADKVGSTPEDMLAGEAATGDASADPFGDLKEEPSAAKAAPGKRQSSETAMALPSEDQEESAYTGGAGTGQYETYTVKAGDTLMKVAFSIYGDVDRWKDLHDLNASALKKGNALRKGMKLKYETPAEAFQVSQHEHTYEIKKGDTLANIADEVYGRKMKYKKLQKYNAQLIKNPNRIFAGFTIFYDITPKEMAEAEARRAQRLAEGGGAPPPAPMGAPPPAPDMANSVDSAFPAPPPSALNPPPKQGAQPKSAAVAPSAIDNSTLNGPGPAPSALPPPAPPAK